MSARKACKPFDTASPLRATPADFITCSISSQPIEWIGTLKWAPIPERSTFGANASVVSGGIRTACTPVPAAERSKVPRLPGSRIWSGIRMKFGEAGIGRRELFRTAKIPCGASVSLRDFITLVETSSTSMPRDFRPSTCDLPLSLSDALYKTNRIGQSAWIDSSTSRTPSTTKAPASRRSFARPNNARTSFIFGF